MLSSVFHGMPLAELLDLTIKIFIILPGMAELGCDSIEKLKSKLALSEMEINDCRKFRDFYNFTFNYAKNPNQKSLGESPRRRSISLFCSPETIVLVDPP